MTAIRPTLCLLLCTLLLAPPTPADAAPHTFAGLSNEQVQVIVDQAMAELRAELAAQQTAFMALLKQATTDADAIRAEVQRAEKGLKNFETEFGKDAQKLVQGLPFAEIGKIAKDTPKQVVDELRQQAEKGAQKLKDLADKARDEFEKGLTDACEQLLGTKLPEWTSPQLDKVAKALEPHAARLGLSGDSAQKVGALADSGNWSAALVAWTPKDLLPPCAQADDLRRRAKAAAETDAAAQMAQTMMTSAITAALSTGNPYVIAIVVVLAILASIFGGGKGKKEKSKDSSEDDTVANEEDTNGDGDSDAPKPPTPVPDIQIVEADTGYRLRGSWPRYELISTTDNFDRCKVDFSLARYNGEPWTLNPATTAIVSGACHRETANHVITINAPHPDGLKRRDFCGVLENGYWGFVPCCHDPDRS